MIPTITDERRVFHSGTALGALAGALTIAVAEHSSWRFLWPELPSHTAWPGSAEFAPLLDWLQVNLGLSIALFATLGLLYVRELLGCRAYLHTLRADQPIDTSRLGLLQLWSSSFFGVGVLWTAIGMRDAMLNSLGGLGADTMPDLNAFQLMARLINGGVLTALTTSVVGGIGAFFMNIATQVLVVLPMQQASERRQELYNHRVLRHLRRLARRVDAVAAEHAPTALAALRE